MDITIVKNGQISRYMKLIKIKPRRLPDVLKYIYVLRSETNETLPEPHHLIPDGTFELIINLGADILQLNAGGHEERRPRSMIAGGFTKQFFLRYGTDIHLIGAVFHPAYNPIVFGDRADIYAGRLVPAVALLGNGIDDLTDRLARSNSIDAIAHLIERYLSERLHFKSTAETGSFRTTAALDEVKRLRGNVAMVDLASHVCMSDRSFRRMFKEHVGMSPKEYARIVRGKNVLHLAKKRKSITEISDQLGFYDPPHLINDFRNISGLDPSAFVSRLNPIDEHFMAVSDYAKQFTDNQRPLRCL